MNTSIFSKTLKNINSFLVTMSMASLIFTPVAMGKKAQAESERINRAQLEQFISELGLNKSMTVGEFYKKNKAQFPERIQQMIEPMMNRFANEAMPQFEVTQVKNSKGESISNLRITSKNQMSNVQFLGEKEKFVKFDNTNLTLEDVANFDDMFAKLYFNDASHRKGMGEALTSPKALNKNLVSDTKKSINNKFTHLPKIDQSMWKKMTPMQRAQFVMNMRLLWSGAQDVLDAKNAHTSGKKTSSLDKWNSFFSMLNEAHASDTKCVVAGYIGTYASGKSCQYPQGAKTQGCDFPCNPTIYGFDSSGKQFCLTSSSELQTATHFNKGCDAKMPLSSVELPLPAAAAKKNIGRYQGIIEANKAQALKDPAAMAHTKRYLESMLNGTPDLRDAFQKGNITAELLAKLQEIQTQFDSTISAARSDCAAASDEAAQYDKNFWGACDQLHKRFLFVSAYLDQNPGCKTDGVKVDPETLMCACPNSSPVTPGAQCSSGSAVSPVKPGGSDSSTGNSSQCDPSCSKGQVCKKTASAGENEVWECVKSGSDSSADKKGGFWSGLWGGIKKATPWVLGGVGLWLLYDKFLKPKKPKLNPAADMCPNGLIPPCGQTCAAPKALLSNGTCGCPACPPGQSLTNANSCLCETTSTTTTTTVYVCADGVTQVNDLANCPATMLTCPDGITQVSNLINCPDSSTKPTTTPSNTTR